MAHHGIITIVSIAICLYTISIGPIDIISKMK
jgi:hypothetical protein